MKIIFLQKIIKYKILINDIYTNITLKIESDENKLNGYLLEFKNIKTRYINNNVFAFHEIYV